MTRPATSSPLVDARRIARQYGLLLKEKPCGKGQMSYIVYRILPDGRPSFLGKRGTPEGIRAYLARVAHS